MWKEDGLVLVKADELPTILFPSNFSAKEVIETALFLESQAFGFHIPFRNLIDLASHYYCKDTHLIDKAKAVVAELNKASAEKSTDDTKINEPKRKPMVN